MGSLMAQRVNKETNGIIRQITIISLTFRTNPYAVTRGPYYSTVKYDFTGVQNDLLKI